MINYSIKKHYSDISEFATAIANVSEAHSLFDNALYIGITIAGDNIIGRRETTDDPFEINLTELFEAQQKLDLISLSTLKLFITTSAVSPAMAILKQLNII